MAESHYSKASSPTSTPNQTHDYLQFTKINKYRKKFIRKSLSKRESLEIENESIKFEFEESTNFEKEERAAYTLNYFQFLDYL